MTGEFNNAESSAIRCPKAWVLRQRIENGRRPMAPQHFDGDVNAIARDVRRRRNDLEGDRGAAHSSRMAIAGSMRSARRAGSTHAASAARIIATAAAANAVASVGVTP